MKLIETDMDRLAGPPTDLAEFHLARNAVLNCCRQFGTVGAMGCCPIRNGQPEEENWPVENQKPDFYVVDDCLHPGQRYIHVDCGARLLTLAVLEAVSAVAAETEWAIWLGLADADGTVVGELVVLHDGVMAGGDLLDQCHVVSDVVLACQGRGEQPLSPRSQ